MGGAGRGWVRAKSCGPRHTVTFVRVYLTLLSLAGAESCRKATHSVCACVCGWVATSVRRSWLSPSLVKELFSIELRDQTRLGQAHSRGFKQSVAVFIMLIRPT